MLFGMVAGELLPTLTFDRFSPAPAILVTMGEESATNRP
jgi:hypothetical protein